MKILFKNTLAGVLAIAGLLGVSLAGSGAFAAEKDVSKALQERVAKMTPEQQTALLALLDQLTSANGTNSSTVATPEEAVRQGVSELETAKAEKKFDVELAMAHISKDFEHYGVGKEGARSFIEGILGAVSSDGVPDITVSLDKTTYKVTGDKAEIYPVEVSTPIGSATVTLYVKLEDGVWRVFDVDGI